jgi:hypothetical protein
VPGSLGPFARMWAYRRLILAGTLACVGFYLYSIYYDFIWIKYIGLIFGFLSVFVATFRKRARGQSGEKPDGASAGPISSKPSIRRVGPVGIFLIAATIVSGGVLSIGTYMRLNVGILAYIFSGFVVLMMIYLGYVLLIPRR